MSLEKAILSGKEHRKWIGKSGYAKSIDLSCRNHGNCKWCKGNRTYNTRKKLLKTLYSQKEGIEWQKGKLI